MATPLNGTGSGAAGHDQGGWVAALQRSEARYRDLAECISDAVFAFDGELHYTTWNRASEVLTGIPSREALGKTFLEVFPDMQGTPVDAAYREALLVREPRNVLSRWNDGTRELVFDIRIYPTEEGIVVLAKDVTARMQAEQAAHRAQNLESVGLLAGGIAHDFNNLLTRILGNVSLARLHATADPQQSEWLLEAEKGVEQAKNLTRQLLTFARGGAPVRQTTRIGRLVRDAAELALRGSKARGAFSIADDLWPADVDAGQLGQVICNLVINADEAMPEGGSLSVRARNLPPGAALPASLAAGRYIEIAVEDQGVGISEEHLPRIFDPFFTTKKRGSGLGLANCHFIVRKHEGEITVDSTPGRGTIFRVLLPASPQDPPEESEAHDVRTGLGRILLMDDDAAIRDVCAQMVAHLGYEVETVAGGAEAAESFRAARACGRPFDAVILDLTVRGGMGGMDAARRIREVDAQATLIVSSGYFNDLNLSDITAHGFRGAIAKPYDVRALSATLHEVIGR